VKKRGNEAHQGFAGAQTDDKKQNDVAGQELEREAVHKRKSHPPAPSLTLLLGCVVGFHPDTIMPVVVPVQSYASRHSLERTKTSEYQRFAPKQLTK
jgi:hypothetical protein